MKERMIAAAVVVAVCVQLAGASGIVRQRYCSTGYYSAPSYGQYDYYQPYYYPKVVLVERNPDYYYSVNEYFRLEQFKFIAALARESKQGTPAAAPAPAPVSPKESPVPVPKKEQALTPQPDSKLTTVLQVAQERCVACHAGDAAKSGLRLGVVQADGTKAARLEDMAALPLSKRVKMWVRANHGEMPPANPDGSHFILPNNEVAILERFMAEAADIAADGKK